MKFIVFVVAVIMPLSVHAQDFMACDTPNFMVCDTPNFTVSSIEPISKEKKINIITTTRCLGGSCNNYRVYNNSNNRSWRLFRPRTWRVRRN